MKKLLLVLLFVGCVAKAAVSLTDVTPGSSPAAIRAVVNANNSLLETAIGEVDTALGTNIPAVATTASSSTNLTALSINANYAHNVLLISSTIVLTNTLAAPGAGPRWVTLVNVGTNAITYGAVSLANGDALTAVSPSGTNWVIVSARDN